MRKILFFLLFSGIFYSAPSLKGQSLKEPALAAQKADDGVLVAYPNPAREFIIVKSKDNNLKIKSVTFYSILGTEVATYTVNMASGEIRLDKLLPGKYLMRYVMEDNTQKILQIIKQ